MTYKREVERVNAFIPVSWGVAGEGFHRGVITSLSIKGCLVKSDIVAALAGKTIIIQFVVDSQFIKLHGEVIYYLRNVGFGVQFTEEAGPHQVLLADMVEQQKNQAVQAS